MFIRSISPDCSRHLCEYSAHTHIWLWDISDMENPKQNLLYFPQIRSSCSLSLQETDTTNQVRNCIILDYSLPQLLHPIWLSSANSGSKKALKYLPIYPAPLPDPSAAPNALALGLEISLSIRVPVSRNYSQQIIFQTEP